MLSHPTFSSLQCAQYLFRPTKSLVTLVATIWCLSKKPTTR